MTLLTIIIDLTIYQRLTMSAAKQNNWAATLFCLLTAWTMQASFGVQVPTFLTSTSLTIKFSLSPEGPGCIWDFLACSRFEDVVVESLQVSFLNVEGIHSTHGCSGKDPILYDHLSFVWRVICITKQKYLQNEHAGNHCGIIGRKKGDTV